MRSLFAFLGGVLVTFLILGWYFGWYNITSNPNGFDFNVNTKQVGQDVGSVPDRLKEAINKNGKPAETGAPTKTPGKP